MQNINPIHNDPYPPRVPFIHQPNFRQHSPINQNKIHSLNTQQNYSPTLNKQIYPLNNQQKTHQYSPNHYSPVIRHFSPNSPHQIQSQHQWNLFNQPPANARPNGNQHIQQTNSPQKKIVQPQFNQLPNNPFQFQPQPKIKNQQFHLYAQQQPIHYHMQPQNQSHLIQNQSSHIQNQRPLTQNQRPGTRNQVNTLYNQNQRWPTAQNKIQVQRPASYSQEPTAHNQGPVLQNQPIHTQPMVGYAERNNNYHLPNRPMDPLGIRNELSKVIKNSNLIQKRPQKPKNIEVQNSNGQQSTQILNQQVNDLQDNPQIKQVYAQQAQSNEIVTNNTDVLAQPLASQKVGMQSNQLSNNYFKTFQQQATVCDNRSILENLQNCARPKSSNANMEFQGERFLQKPNILAQLKAHIHSKGTQQNIMKLKQRVQQLQKDNNGIKQNYEEQIRMKNKIILELQTQNIKAKQDKDRAEEERNQLEKDKKYLEEENNKFQKAQEQTIRQYKTLQSTINQLEQKLLEAEGQKTISFKVTNEKNQLKTQKDTLLLKIQTLTKNLKSVQNQYQTARKVGQQQINQLMVRLESKQQLLRTTEENHRKEKLKQAESNRLFEKKVIYQLKKENQRLWSQLIADKLDKSGNSVVPKDNASSMVSNDVLSTSQQFNMAMKQRMAHFLSNIGSQ